jgi:two-component system, OmpR family, response regulator
MEVSISLSRAAPSRRRRARKPERLEAAMISDVSPPTILVVEDEAIVQECLVAELEEAGYRVLSADTGEDALAIIKDRAHNIDWLFTDIRLPGCIDGWRVADEFRLTHPFRPVVYATAYAPGETRPQLHGSLVFRKPYRPAEIVAAFRRLSTELQGATTNA